LVPPQRKEAAAKIASASSTPSSSAVPQRKVALSDPSTRTDPAERLGFCRTLVSKAIGLSPDGRAGTRVPGAQGSCVLIGDRPLQRDPGGGIAFTLLVTVVSAPSRDGLFSLGVTTTASQELQALPDVPDQVANSWLAGFDGSTWDGQTWGLCDWDPSSLASGDMVAVSISASNEMRVSIGGVVQAQLQVNVLPSAPLYVLVDLSGNVAGVKILLGTATTPAKRAR